MQKEALRQEADAYQKEIASYDAERDLLTARGDLLTRRVAQAEKAAKGLQAAVDKMRKEEAARAAKEAEAAAARAARAHPLLRQLAEANAALANQRTGPKGLAAKIPRVTKRLELVKANLERLQQDLKSLVEKEKAVGKTATFGILLRKQQAELPDVRDYRSRMKARQTEIATAQLRLIELQDERSGLSDIDTALNGVLAKLDPSVRGPSGSGSPKAPGSSSTPSGRTSTS